MSRPTVIELTATRRAKLEAVVARSSAPAGLVRRARVVLLSDGVRGSEIATRLVLRRSGMKPHLVRTYKVSRDPAFAEKVMNVVGLHLNPPTNAIVLSVDEKTSIQALERTQLPLPLRTGRAVRHTHDYKRHGVVDLFAPLEVATGRSRTSCETATPEPVPADDTRPARVPGSQARPEPVRQTDHRSVAWRAPCWRSRAEVSGWVFSSAMSRGVRPSPASWLGSAPFSSRRRARSVRPR
jgi:hypothetical protein